MNNFPWGFVDLLIHAFGLSDCEAADLSDRAQCLVDVGCHHDQILEKLWVLANVLSSNGSKMQPMWDRMKQLQDRYKSLKRVVL